MSGGYTCITPFCGDDCSQCSRAVPSTNAAIYELKRQRDELLAALNYSRDHIEASPHGDNCFVSAAYDGDPGDRCNCGKDSMVDFLDAAISSAEGGM